MGAHSDKLKHAFKEEILAQFSSANAREGDALSPEWLHNEFMPNLGTKELKVLEETLAEMINQGIIEYAGGKKPTWRLTKKGEDLLQ